MSVSGSVNYNDTRNEIITDALILLGVLGAEESVQAADLQLANRFLNRMVKSWDAQGIHLWTYNEATLFITPSTSKYAMANGSSDAYWSDTVVDTTLGGAEASGQTVITVTTSTGMTAADIVGIVLDDKTIHWSTIVSVDSSTQITITNATTGAAASGNRVYTFTSRANRPVKIHSIRRKTGNGTSATEIPLIELSRQEYFDLPAKASTGYPTQYYYDPQLATGQLYLWPTPDNGAIRYNITYQSQIDDFDAAGDTSDLPQEWLECLVYNLASRMAPAFGKEDKAKKYILPVAELLLNKVSTFDKETTSIQIIPDTGN